jgi:chemosensory pili system protein ChpA (sensor histidine kinase/response regulator)
MNLVGELVSARTRLERRLGELDQVADLLRFTGGRMGQVVGEFERKYIDPRLSMPGTPTETAAPVDTPRPATPLAELFEELEFDRYDDFSVLARSVGELSTDIREIQARLAGTVRGLRVETAQIQRLGADVRTQVSRARMVPIARLFGRLPRQIREIARAANRNVSLTVEGETVEVDSSVVEQLADPLLHLIQNAIVHGIEPEEDRLRAGKPPQGSVVLRAVQAGGTLRMDLLDDGRGIDVEAVKARARARGLVPAAALERLGHREAIELIFLPGLSTAAGTTTVAGRGVGMDVVRTSVVRMGGDIDVETRAGAGTRFTITLPLAVAITDALLVRVGREVMAVPGGAVKAVLLVRRDTVQRIEGEEHITLDQETLRLRHLGDVLGRARGHVPDPLVVLALKIGHRTLPLVVDELLRKEEVVVKGLGRFLDNLAPYSGATISAEGRVVLILDAARLFSIVTGGALETSGSEVEGASTHSVAEERRVLLVDDSVSVRRFVGQMLERAGLEVVTANDGAEALERLRNLRVDAVVTDLEMPKVNGFELIRDLRRRTTTRGLPIVVLTTRAGDKHADLARQLGATHYVTKPVEEQGFVRLVEALTGGLSADTAGGTP